MSTANPFLFDVGSWGDYSQQSSRRVPNVPTQPVDPKTDLQSIDRFKADVGQLGSVNEPKSLRKRLAGKIDRSKFPVQRIGAIVEHCIDRASQDKVDAAADVLAIVPERFVQFLETYDPYATSSRDDQIWLFSTAISRSEQVCGIVRERFIARLCDWLRIDDPSVRESAANALGAILAVEATAALEDALGAERHPVACEAIEDALVELRRR